MCKLPVYCVETNSGLYIWNQTQNMCLCTHVRNQVWTYLNTTYVRTNYSSYFLFLHKYVNLKLRYIFKIYNWYIFKIDIYFFFLMSLVNVFNTCTFWDVLIMLSCVRLSKINYVLRMFLCSNLIDTFSKTFQKI